MISFKKENSHYCLNLCGIKIKHKNKNKLNEIKNQINYMAGMYNNFVWNNSFEYEFLKERWEKDIDKYLSKESYLRLIKDLDDASITLIQRTLTRIKKILSSKGSPIDLFTQEEMSELYYMLHTYIKSILKISDDVYACGKYLLPIDHFEKGIFIDKHGINGLNCEYFKNKAIIDVGAFIGDSACILSEKTNDKVYCFEALKENYELMLKTIEYNNFSNVIPVNYALGEDNGKAETINLYENIANGSCCQVKPVNNDNASSDAINVITLDKFVEDNHIKVGLIKVDIEGAEQQFIKGAKETIKKQKPSLIMSIYHNPDDFFNIKTILKDLVPEYKFKVFKPTDSCAVIDTVLLCEI